MSGSNKSFVVFEHQVLRSGSAEGCISATELKSLQKFHGEKGVPYYSLVHKGLKFNEHVGVIQVGNTTIEILPKTDKVSNEVEWRGVLIGMLRATGIFEIKAPSSSHLKIKHNSILDLYFEMYVSEVEYLIHHGLSRRYRKTEGNCNSFKGTIQFGKHIQQNIIHQERVYTKYTVFDVKHPLHQILYKAVCLIASINTNSLLQSRICGLLLNFPEMPDIRVSEKVFDSIILNRNTNHYKKAFDISRMLLLNYHPDVIRGREHVLAIMFDMNMLWEKFVFNSLSKGLKDGNAKIKSKSYKQFWKSTGITGTRIIPDIVIESKSGSSYVLDTKWKNLGNNTVSSHDLRQMYVYHEYFYARKVAILYPGERKYLLMGEFLSPSVSENWFKECCLLPLEVDKDIKTWQKNICHEVKEWMNENAPVI